MFYSVVFVLDVVDYWMVGGGVVIGLGDVGVVEY